jgi:hypothetical protein
MRRGGSLETDDEVVLVHCALTKGDDRHRRVRGAMLRLENVKMGDPKSIHEVQNAKRSRSKVFAAAPTWWSLEEGT